MYCLIAACLFGWVTEDRMAVMDPDVYLGLGDHLVYRMDQTIDGSRDREVDETESQKHQDGEAQVVALGAEIEAEGDAHEKESGSDAYHLPLVMAAPGADRLQKNGGGGGRDLHSRRHGDQSGGHRGQIKSRQRDR